MWPCWPVALYSYLFVIVAEVRSVRPSDSMSVRTSESDVRLNGSDAQEVITWSMAADLSSCDAVVFAAMDLKKTKCNINAEVVCPCNIGCDFPGACPNQPDQEFNCNQFLANVKACARKDCDGVPGCDQKSRCDGLKKQMTPLLPSHKDGQEYALWSGGIANSRFARMSDPHPHMWTLESNKGAQMMMWVAKQVSMKSGFNKKGAVDRQVWSGCFAPLFNIISETFVARIEDTRGHGEVVASVTLHVYFTSMSISKVLWAYELPAAAANKHIGTVVFHLLGVDGAIVKEDQQDPTKLTAILPTGIVLRDGQDKKQFEAALKLKLCGMRVDVGDFFLENSHRVCGN